MFEFVRKHNRLFQVVLVVLILPSFAIVGIQGYSRFSDGGAGSVATVAGKPVTQSEFDAALRDETERLRTQMPTLDPALLKTSAFRQQALDTVVRTHVFAAAAEQLNLATPDERLRRVFQSDPQFEFLRKPDGTVNGELLAAQGMSSDQFVARLRQDLSTRQVLQGVTGTELATKAVATPALDAMFQQRDVQVQRFDSSALFATVHPTDADIAAYYKAHAADYRAPDEASIEYVVLDLDAITKQSPVPTEDEIRKYYADNSAKYSVPEERRASHILVNAAKDAPAAERAKARQKAEQLLAEVTRNPASFADVARKNSDDPGSAAKGGDLDFFGKGAMVKPFEDTAFALKPGQTSGIVESEFGFHIIRLTDVRGGTSRPLADVHGDIEALLRKQAAQAKFTKLSTDFGNAVYEQPDSLRPVADRFGLTLQTASGVTKAPKPDAKGVLASKKFLNAVFAPDAVRNKRNGEAVEVAANQLAAGRVTTLVPAHQLAYADVREGVRGQVIAAQAGEAARKAGLARLAVLKAAPATDLGSPTVTVSRRDPQRLPPPLLQAVLGAPASRLPTVVGADLGTAGYAVARVVKVVAPAASAPEAAQAQGQYAQAWGDAEAQAYYANLKQRFKVTIHPKALAAENPVDADAP